MMNQLANFKNDYLSLQAVEVDFKMRMKEHIIKMLKRQKDNFWQLLTTFEVSTIIDGECIEAVITSINANKNTLACYGYVKSKSTSVFVDEDARCLDIKHLIGIVDEIETRYIMSFNEIVDKNCEFIETMSNYDVEQVRGTIYQSYSILDCMIGEKRDYYRVKSWKTGEFTEIKTTDENFLKTF